MMLHKFYVKQPQEKNEKGCIKDLSDASSELFLSMKDMIVTDKPLLYSVEFDEKEYKGSISVLYYNNNEKKFWKDSIEYGAMSGRLYQMEFSSKEDFQSNRDSLKQLWQFYQNENTLSMRRKDNSTLAQKVVEKIAEYFEKLMQGEKKAFLPKLENSK